MVHRYDTGICNLECSDKHRFDSNPLNIETDISRVAFSAAGYSKPIILSIVWRNNTGLMISEFANKENEAIFIGMSVSHE